MSKVIVKLRRLLCPQAWVQYPGHCMHNKYLSPCFYCLKISPLFLVLVSWHFASMYLRLPLYSFSLAGSGTSDDIHHYSQHSLSDLS